MLDIDVKNEQNLALRSQFLPPIAIVRQATKRKYARPRRAVFQSYMPPTVCLVATLARPARRVFSNAPDVITTLGV